MDGTSPSSPSLPREARRRRLVLSSSQKDALQALFQQNPYPATETRERLAQEIGIPESRVQVWFQNQRTRCARQARLGPPCSPGEGQPQQRPEQAPSWTPGCVPKEGRRKRTAISAAQSRILVQAFEGNRFPGIATRERLAQQTGLPESRIHIWFQNRRARHPGRSPGGPAKSPAGGAGPELLPAVPQEQSQPATVPSSAAHGSPRNPLVGQPLWVAALPPTPVPLGPWEPSGGLARPAPTVPMSQPAAQPVPGGQMAHPPLILMGPLTVVPTPAVGLCHAQTPFWPPYQGSWPGTQGGQHTHLAAPSLPCGDTAQPQPDDPRQKPQGLGRPDASQPLHQWGEGPAGRMVPGASGGGAPQRPAHAQTPPLGQPLPLPATAAAAAAAVATTTATTATPEPSQPLGPPDQPYAATSSLLDQLLASPDMQDKARAFLSPGAQEEDPLPPELPLSEEEFQVLLDML